MKRKIENTMYIICALIIAWIMVCWINVAIHNGNQNYVYPKWNIFTWISESEAESYVVVDCQREANYYVVTIEDRKGNQWAYYDNSWMPNGYLLQPTFNENGEIIDIKY